MVPLLKKYHGHKVLIEYIQLSFIQDEESAQKLHMFFSPTCIPRGLTKEEIDLCIRLYPLREQQKNAHEVRYGKMISQTTLRRQMIAAHLMLGNALQKRRTNIADLEKSVAEIESHLPALADVMIRLPTMQPPQLPEELAGSESVVMARERFRRGIHRFVEQAIARNK